MALHIENAHVSQLAMELAQLTGESITEAVGHALETRLSELQRRKDRQGLAERLMEIGRQCASQAPNGWLGRDFDRELYGD